ncbi:MAG: hypothetical protein ACI38A_07315 [Candidatus Ornithomonoglobus sp.]
MEDALNEIKQEVDKARSMPERAVIITAAWSNSEAKPPETDKGCKNYVEGQFDIIIAAACSMMTAIVDRAPSDAAAKIAIEMFNSQTIKLRKNQNQEVNTKCLK